MADYPNSIKQFTTKIDKSAGGISVGPEYFNVPGSGPYTIYLDHVPKDSASTVIGASGGASWAEVSTAPAATHQYLVDYTTGKITFYSANANEAVQAVYNCLGDDIMAEHMNDIQNEIVALESELGENPSGPYATLGDRLVAMSAAAAASGFNGQNITDNTVRAGALRDDIKGVAWDATRDVLTDITVHKNKTPGAHAATAISATGPGTTGITNVQGHINLIGTTTPTTTNPHGMSLSDFGSIINVARVITSQYVDAGPYVTATTILASGSAIFINTQSSSLSPVDGNSSIYFYEGGSIAGARIGWNDSAGRFEINKPLIVFGDLTASGNFYPSASGTRDIGSQAVAFSTGNFRTVRSDIGIVTELDAAVIEADKAIAGTISTTGITASGNIDSEASGVRTVGSKAVPFASGCFNTVNAEGGGYTIGDSTGTSGSFISNDGKTITVKGGIIVSIV